MPSPGAPPVSPSQGRDLVLTSAVVLLFLVGTFAGEAFVPTRDRPLPGEDQRPTTGPPAPVMVEQVLVSENGFTSEGSSTEVPFEVSVTRLAKVNATLTWTDDYGANDEFGLTLSLNGTEVETGSDQSGSVKIVYSPIGNSTGGSFIARIDALNCPGAVVSIPGVDRDQGNDWSLEVRVTSWE